MRDYASEAKRYIISRMSDPNDLLSKLVSGFPEISQPSAEVRWLDTGLLNQQAYHA